MRKSDPEIVVAGGVFNTDLKKWILPAKSGGGGGGGDEDGDRFIITLRVRRNTVVAIPDTAVVNPGDVVEWRANRGVARRIKFLDPGTDYPGKEDNDTKIDAPKCSRGKCTMTVPNNLTAWKPYTYVAFVRHDGKNKVADPEIVVAGGGPPPGR